MKLSIITVNLNNKDGLYKTIMSVREQTFKDFEYIIIDGGSSDQSLEVIHNNEDCISHWVSEQDDGIFQAMNKGIIKSRGEYLLFLNSGDFFVNCDVLEKVFMENRSADILCARCNILKNGSIVWTSDPPEFVTFGTLYIEGLAHQSTFIKKKLFDNFGLYREDFRYNSDVEFWYRTIILNGASTQKVNEITTNYSLGGLSDRYSKHDSFLKEKQIIYDNPIFQRIIPDYECWKNDIKVLSEYSWIHDYPLIRKSISILHKILHKL